MRHVLLRQGVLGIKVKIMKAYDPTGVAGPSRPLPDVVTIIEPKEELPTSLVASGLPVSEQARGATEIPAPAPAPVAVPAPVVEEAAAPVAAATEEASW